MCQVLILQLNDHQVSVRQHAPRWCCTTCRHQRSKIWGLSYDSSSILLPWFWCIVISYIVYFRISGVVNIINIATHDAAMGKLINSLLKWSIKSHPLCVALIKGDHTNYVRTCLLPSPLVMGVRIESLGFSSCAVKIWFNVNFVISGLRYYSSSVLICCIPVNILRCRSVLLWNSCWRVMWEIMDKLIINSLSKAEVESLACDLVVF
jgi:hypothetical protein